MRYGWGNDMQRGGVACQRSENNRTKNATYKRGTDTRFAPTIPNLKTTNRMTQDKTNKVSNVPPLRFPEFSGEYEKHTLGEMGNGIIGLTYSPRDVVEIGGTIVFRSSNIQNGEIDYSDLVRVNMNIRENIITRKGDLLICARNGSPRLIGKNVLLTEYEAGQTFGAFMLVYRSPNNPYIHKLLNTKRYVSQVKENLGARINQITTANLNDFEFYFPTNIEESKKVADFIGLLDKRIATQIRVIEDLQTLKKAISTKVFTEIKGCNSEKLGNICSITTGKLDANAMTDEGEYMFFTCSRENYKTDTFAFDGEALLIAGNGEIGSVKYYNGKFNAYQRTYVLQNFSANIKYLQYYIEHHLPKRVLKEKNVGAMPYIVLSTLADMPILLPSDNKQNNIVNVLQVIENKIYVEDSVLDQYKQQKQYILQQMFI